MAQALETAVKSKIVSQVALATAVIAGIIIIGTAAAGLIIKNQTRGDGKGYGYGNYPPLPPQPPLPPTYGYNNNPPTLPPLPPIYGYDRVNNTWNGCRGTGLNVCVDALRTVFGSRSSTEIPRYFRDHPQCIRNTTCAGQFFQCEPVCDHPLGRNTSYRPVTNLLNLYSPAQPSGTLVMGTLTALRIGLNNPNTRYEARLSNVTVNISAAVSSTRGRPNWSIRSAKLYQGGSQVCSNGIITGMSTIRFNNCNTSRSSLITPGASRIFEVKVVIGGTTIMTNDTLRLSINNLGTRYANGNLWWRSSASPTIDVKWVNTTIPSLQGGLFIL